MSKQWKKAEEVKASKLNLTGAGFGVTEQDPTPNLTLLVGPGVAVVGDSFVKYDGGNSPSFTAPAANPRIDLLAIDSTGTIVRIAGTEAASPVAPVYPSDKFVLCEVYNRVGQASVRNVDTAGLGYVYRDARAFNSGGGNKFTRSYVAGETLAGNEPVFVADGTEPNGTILTDFSGGLSVSANTTWGYSGNNDNVAQSYIPAAAQILYDIHAFVGVASGSPGDQVRIDVYADNSNKPTGALIASSTPITVSGAQAERTFVFPTPPTLASGVKVWFMLVRTGGSSTSHWYNVGFVPDGTYSSGSALGSNAAWTSPQGYDFWFKLTLNNGYYTATRVYKAKIDTSYPNFYKKYVGFAVAAASAGATVPVANAGRMSSFSGLTGDVDYYLTATAGVISSTPVTNMPFKVGHSVPGTTTDLFIEKLSILGCRLKQTSGSSVSGSGLSTQAFQAEDFDTDNMHDNVTNNSRITFRTAGWYAFGGCVNAGSTTTHISGVIVLNGSTTIAVGGGPFVWGGGGNIMGVRYFAVNDYIEYQAGANSGTTSSGSESTNFWAYRIGE